MTAGIHTQANRFALNSVDAQDGQNYFAPMVTLQRPMKPQPWCQTLLRFSVSNRNAPSCCGRKRKSIALDRANQNHAQKRLFASSSGRVEHSSASRNLLISRWPMVSGPLNGLPRNGGRRVLPPSREWTPPRGSHQLCTCCSVVRISVSARMPTMCTPSSFLC